MTQTLISTPTTTPPGDDWAFCVQALEEVSRSFATPIMLLPEKQRRALTVGYLLCRVADTIEDSVGIDSGEKDELFSLFQDVLRGNCSSAELSRRFSRVETTESEQRLVQGLGGVMSVFNAQDTATKRATVLWVSEMADGMRLYGHRADGHDFFSLMTIEDLERYCYFVAGTVGHLITDLFASAIGAPAIEAALRKNAESFGLGLQLVNIVKDISDDFARGVSYLPRQYCLEEGFEPERILDQKNRQAAGRVVARVIARAHTHLDAALEYTLTIPPAHHHLRIFCLLPLWMAAETLSLAEGNDDLFAPGVKVKIGREVVAGIIADCGRDCQNDAALRIAYAARMRRPVHVES